MLKGKICNRRRVKDGYLIVELCTEKKKFERIRVLLEDAHLCWYGALVTVENERVTLVQAPCDIWYLSRVFGKIPNQQLAAALIYNRTDDFEKALQLLSKVNAIALAKRELNEPTVREMINYLRLLNGKYISRNRVYRLNPTDALLLDRVLQYIIEPLKAMGQLKEVVVDSIARELGRTNYARKPLTEEDLIKNQCHPRQNLCDMSERRIKYLEQKKLPQVLLLCNAVSVFLTDDRCLHVWDVGGGRGDLAVALAAVFRDKIKVYHIDRRQEALETARQFAVQALCDQKITFHQDFPNDDAPCDLVIGLHTCGGLSDLVMDLAARRKAALLLIPCCYSKYRDLRIHPEIIELAMRKTLHIDKEGLAQSLMRLADSGDTAVADNAAVAVSYVALKSLIPSDNSRISSIFKMPYSTKNLIIASQFGF